MQKACILATLVLELVVPALAQQRPVSPQDLEFFQQLNHERDPARQLSVLREWEAAIPKSEWHRERLLFFMNAYKGTDQLVNSFKCAVDLLALDSRDLTALYSVVTVAPLLQTPTPDQIRLTEEAAHQLLSSPIATTKTPALTEANPEQVTGREDQRLAAFLREIRIRKQIRPADIEIELRHAAESALTWARNRKQ